VPQPWKTPYSLWGLEATRHIILGILLQALFPQRQLLENFDRRSFFRHCLGTVLLRSSCARRRV